MNILEITYFLVGLSLGLCIKEYHLDLDLSKLLFAYRLWRSGWPWRTAIWRAGL